MSVTPSLVGHTHYRNSNLNPKRLAWFQSLVGYTHLKSSKNLDFVPGQSTLTLSNIKDKTAYVKESEIEVYDAKSIKEYSCMQASLPAAHMRVQLHAGKPARCTPESNRCFRRSSPAQLGTVSPWACMQPHLAVGYT